MVPLVGKLAEDLTKIYLELNGSLKDPKIRMVEAKGIVTETVDETESLPRAMGKDLKKVFSE